ncbi:MAG: aspartyl protease family protein [Draconibacterium sp.]
MKPLKNLLIFSILTLTSCSSIQKNNPILENRLSELLQNKRFFSLKQELNEDMNELSEDKILFYKAQVENAFCNGEQSNEYAELLLKKYKTNFNDTLLIKLLSTTANNYVRDYQYKKASETYKTILEQYDNVLDSSEIESYKNVYQLFGTLESVKPQQIHKTDNTTIPSYRNRFNHLMTPVKSGQIEDEFIFDTGANLSTISDSYAHKMGLKIYESNINVGSATEIDIQTKLAVADSLYVGDILFENVVFLVAPDKQLSFPSVNYEIHGIIGFPVIRQMNEIRIQNDGTIKVPKVSQDRKLNNMFMDGLTPVVQMFSQNDTLLMIFDTGAKETELYQNYYEKHKTQIESNSELQDAQQGGAGGIVDVKSYTLKDFPYTIGTKSNTLPKISITISESSSEATFNGNLGQDIFTQFNDMILNFEYMYLDFE